MFHSYGSEPYCMKIMDIIYLSTQRMEPFYFGESNRHNRIDVDSTLLLTITLISCLLQRLLTLLIQTVPIVE